MAKKVKTSSKRKYNTDNNLMLLAGAAAVIVGFFAVATYKPTAPVTTPSPKAPITLNLNAQNGSQEKGTATLHEVNGKVIVTLSLTGFAKNVTQPAHIHAGKCPNPGAVKYPLTSVVNGQSSTVLNVTMEQLKAMEPLALNVHKSTSQSSIYFSCGDLKL